MKIINRILNFLKTRDTGEIQDFKRRLQVKYGFLHYLYATSEGLPVMGNFDNYEELSARIPELLKLLSLLNEAKYYRIKAEDTNYIIVQVSQELFFLGECIKELSLDEIEKLIRETLEEFGL